MKLKLSTMQEWSWFWNEARAHTSRANKEPTP